MDKSTEKPETASQPDEQQKGVANIRSSILEAIKSTLTHTQNLTSLMPSDTDMYSKNTSGDSYSKNT
jgi:hypothetical protein